MQDKYSASAFNFPAENKPQYIHVTGEELWLWVGAWVPARAGTGRPPERSASVYQQLRSGMVSLRDGVPAAALLQTQVFWAAAAATELYQLHQPKHVL